MTIVMGDEEAKAYLRAMPAQVDAWLSELVDDFADFAGERLRAHAPGRIDQLVDVAHDEPGGGRSREAVAGILPDVTQENFSRGLGSDPADWPVFPDVGTGIYGEYHKEIQVIPGNVMVFEHGDIRVFARSTRGQPAQHFSDRAFEDTVGWAPARVELAVREWAVRPT